MDETRRRIFAGNDIRVLFADGPDDLVVITFSPFSAKLPGSIFGAPYFSKRSIAYVAFRSLANHWWQTREMDEAIKVVLPLIAKFKRVYTYGVSMGGHAALAFSKALGAQRVIAGAPQFSIHHELAPFDDRWTPFANKHPLCFPRPLEGVSETAEKVIIYDPFVRLDAMQVKQFGSIPNTHYLKATFAGHHTLHLLRDSGVLSKFMGLMLSEELRIPDVKALLKERVKAPAYIIQHAIRRFGKRDPSKAIELIESVPAPLNSWQVLVMAAQVYRQAGRHNDALNHAKTALSLKANKQTIRLVRDMVRVMQPSASDADVLREMVAFNQTETAKITRLFA